MKQYIIGSISHSIYHLIYCL